MSAIKTVLEWPYEPADFFESPVSVFKPDFGIRVEGGLCRVTLSAPRDPVPEGIRDEALRHLKIILLVHTLNKHRKFSIGNLTIQQTGSDGERRTTHVVGTSRLVLWSSGDMISTDATGRVIRDTKAERVAAHEAFFTEVLRASENDPFVLQLLHSYERAVADPDDELIHLYEILDALETKLGKRFNQSLGITKAERSSFGKLANHEPVRQGRHRGQMLGGLRMATPQELAEARAIARKIIFSYAKLVR